MTVADKTKFAKLLRTIVATIENLEESEIDQLIAGKARLTLDTRKKTKDTSSKSPIDRSLILSRLDGTTDRVEARKILGEIETRDALADFARTLKVHIVKHDRREDIESKIIEFLIGGKLRTEAIRTLNLRGGGSKPSKD